MRRRSPGAADSETHHHARTSLRTGIISNTALARPASEFLPDRQRSILINPASKRKMRNQDATNTRTST